LVAYSSIKNLIMHTTECHAVVKS